MKIRALAAAAAALPLAVGSLAIAPAEDAVCYVVDAGDPNDPEDDVEVCHADGYFTGNTNRIGNLYNTGHDDAPSWDDTVPTDSYQSGAGAGTYVTSTGAPEARAVFEGEFTGDIDSIAVEQFFISPVDHYFWEVIDVEVSIEVDGIEVGGTDDIELPVLETADGVGKMQFAVTGLYDERPSIQGSEEAHTVRIEIAGALFPWDEALFVYDAAEVPSRVIFNGGEQIKWWAELDG